MSTISAHQFFETAKRLSISSGMLTKSEAEKCFLPHNFVPLGADGSTRKFWRLENKSSPVIFPPILIIAPGKTSETELAEARAAWKIGCHLKKNGVAVPEQYGWDSEYGVLLVEDLGDIRFHEFILDNRKDKKTVNTEDVAIVDMYKTVLDGLVTMQIQGGKGFIKSWCWDSACYDKTLMIERESHYFLDAFWAKYLSQETPQGLVEEFDEIASRAAKAPITFFLHRDFQSRNIMLKETKSWFIDFQGGRMGPLGYDVASLLIDPYSTLSLEVQELLLDYYIGLLEKSEKIATQEFYTQYNYLALQRNLQILGAFAFLTMVRKKKFFARYIVPAIDSISTRLEQHYFRDFTVLRKTIGNSRKLLGISS